MQIINKRYKTKSVALATTLALVLLIVGIPQTTETMVINSKLKRLSLLPNLGLNRIISYQDNPKLPVSSSNSTIFRIVHIGDSHIQAGFFTGEVRRLLSSYYNDSAISVGYVFPYNLAGTNSPSDYSFTSNSNWTFRKVLISDECIGAGLSGMIMETADINPSLSVSLKSKKNGDKYFDEITVLFESESNEIEVLPEGIKFDVKSKDANHVHLKFDSPVSEANIQFGGQGAKLSISGLILENSKSKIVYNSAGLNGADVKSYLRAANLGNQLALISPQLVIVSLGTNDAYHPLFDVSSFNVMLDSLILNIKNAVPSSTILLTIPGDHLVSRINPNPNLLLVKEAIITSAIENGCCIWDFHSLMGGEGSIKIWNGMGLTAPDLLHLNAKGYRLQGELLFEALTTSI